MKRYEQMTVMQWVEYFTIMAEHLDWLVFLSRISNSARALPARALVLAVSIVEVLGMRRSMAGLKLRSN